VLQYVVWGWLVIVGSPFMGLPVQAEEKAEIEYAKGIVEYSNRNYIDALEHFRTAAQLTPDNADVQFYLGLTLFRLGEFPDAVAALEKALQLDPTKRYIHHHLGLTYHFEKRYEDALAQFRLADEFDPQKAANHYYLGYTHYLLEQHEQVLAPMQRALELDPSLAPSAQYYRGLALYSLDRDPEARQAFNAVITADPQSPVAQNARRYLDVMQARVRERRLYQVDGSVSFQYDDNVILEPNAIEISGESDSRLVFTLRGALIPVRTPRWRAGVEYSLFQSVHFTLGDFDIESHTLELFTRFTTDRVTLRLATDVNATFLGSRLFANHDLFSEAITVQPSVTIQQSKALFIEIATLFRYSDYFDDLSAGQDPAVRDRDGWTIRAKVDQFLIFNQRRALARAGYAYEGSRNEGTDWEYDSHQIGLGLHMLLWKNFILDVDWSYTRFNYLHINSFDADQLAILDAFDRREREDDRIIGALSLTQLLNQFLSLSLSFVHTTNFSNIAFFEYQRNVVALTLTGRY
jgi:tetratricopeptide (TPR) repeat protein